MTALNAITHTSDESYERYIERVRLNPLAAKVKMADLTHNMDLTRLPEPTEKDFQRIKKYESTYKKLLEPLS
jgi:hypothetical protein